MVDDEPRNTGPPAGWKPANGVWTLLSPCSLQDHAGKGFSIRKGRKCPIETNHVTSPLVVVQKNHDSMMKYASTDSEKSPMEQVYLTEERVTTPLSTNFTRKMWITLCITASYGGYRVDRSWKIL